MYTETPTAFPIEKPTTPAGQRAAELHQSWTDQFERVDQVDADCRNAQAKLVEAEDALRDVLGKRERGDATDADVSAAEATCTTAQAEANAPWQERRVAAAQLAEQRRAEYEEFVNANLDELVTELEVAAKAAVDAIRRGAEAFVAGFAQFNQCREKGDAMIKPAQLIDGQSIPVLGKSAKAALREVERFLGDPSGAPVPIPEQRFLRWRRSQLAAD